MPDDVGGPLFPDSEGPDRQERGAADEAFAAVVLDEDFVEAAEIHEPTAAERILYAALERAESEAAGEPGLRPDLDADEAALLGRDGAGFDDVVFDEAALDDEDQDEGRFDRSDYLRYLPDDDDHPPRPGPSGAYAPAVFTGPGVRRSGPPSWRPARWQRPVACVLAMVMGLSMIAFVLMALQRAGSAQRGESGSVAPSSEPRRPSGGPPELTDGGP